MSYLSRAQYFPDINFKNNHLVGFQWPVISKRTGESYTVEMTDFGFTCTCMGFRGHGRCKHNKEIHDKLVCDEPDPVYTVPEPAGIRGCEAQ